MVWAPNFLRCCSAPSYLNAAKEMAYMRLLVQYLETEEHSGPGEEEEHSGPGEEEEHSGPWEEEDTCDFLKASLTNGGL